MRRELYNGVKMAEIVCIWRNGAQRAYEGRRLLARGGGDVAQMAERAREDQ
jgi:hypothetical protein